MRPSLPLRRASVASEPPRALPEHARRSTRSRPTAQSARFPRRRHRRVGVVSATSSPPPPSPHRRSRSPPPSATAARASSSAASTSTSTSTPPSLPLDHEAFSPVVSRPLSGRSASSSSSVVVVRPLHPSDVEATTSALLSAFEEADGSGGGDQLERRQLERRLRREARRYCADPSPWLLHSVELPPPRAPAPPAARTEERGEGEEERAEDEGEDPPSSSSSAESPWWSPFPSKTEARARQEKRRAEEEEAASSAWEEALEDAWGRWLWLVAEVGEETGEGRTVVGAAALLFHDRSASLRALDRLASSPLGSAPENRRRWPRPNAASMDYCLWLRERFPPGWPPRTSKSSDGTCPDSPPSEGVFGRSASLWWVGTDPIARGRGVGAALLDASAAVAAAAGFVRLFAQVEDFSFAGGDGLRPGRSRGGGLASAAAWLGGSGGSRERGPSAAARMYRSAGFVAVPPPVFQKGAGGGGGGGAVDASAVLLVKEIW